MVATDRNRPMQIYAKENWRAIARGTQARSMNNEGQATEESSGSARRVLANMGQGRPGFTHRTRHACRSSGNFSRSRRVVSFVKSTWLWSAERRANNDVKAASFTCEKKRAKRDDDVLISMIVLTVTRKFRSWSVSSDAECFFTPK